MIEARRVVAGVVEGTGWRAVRHRVGRYEVAPRELGGVEAESPGCDRHRPLEPEVELRPSEAPVQAGRLGVREHDPVAHGDVLDGVRARQRTVHPIEGGRLGRPDVRPDVLDRVVAEGDQTAVGREPCLDLGRATRGRCARCEMLETILDPRHGHAEMP